MRKDKKSSVENEKFHILDKVNNADDLRALSDEEIPKLCSELREFLVEAVSKNGGHLASNLGAVELSVALHRVFDLPHDRVIFDVGHQSYVHKILSGRKDRFDTLRKGGGISGFEKMSESEYDAFGTGHASTSVSAALGYAVSDKLSGNDTYTVAVLGDGAFTGGMVHEALNNCDPSLKLIIVLNENEMSISKNRGALASHIARVRSTKGYFSFKRRTADVLTKLPLVGRPVLRAMKRAKDFTKKSLYGTSYFESLGLVHLGPVDGNDVNALAKVLKDIKDMQGPKLLHIHTTKGKGFEPAEKAATIWHAPGKFDKETGERIVTDTEGMPPLYQEVFGHTLLELAKANDKIVGVTPAMPSGCSMNILMKEMPDRGFDVGIAEGHAVTFSGGMAKDGLIPFCNIYSSFMQRAYDNVIHDVAIHKQHVVFCLDRAGLVGEDGPTHHGAFDLAYLRSIPNLTVASPLNEHELRKLMYTAQLPDMGPFAIRYPRGRGVLPDWRCPLETVEVGKGQCLKEGKDIAVLSLGPIGNTAMEAIAAAEAKSGKSIAHYDLRFLKPLDRKMLDEIGKNYDSIVTIEDGVLQGGMGSAILEFMSDHGYSPTIRRIGLPDKFVQHGTPKELYHICGMDAESIEKVLLSF